MMPQLAPEGDIEKIPRPDSSGAVVCCSREFRFGIVLCPGKCSSIERCQCGGRPQRRCFIQSACCRARSRAAEPCACKRGRTPPDRRRREDLPAWDWRRSRGCAHQAHQRPAEDSISSTTATLSIRTASTMAGRSPSDQRRRISISSHLRARSTSVPDSCYITTTISARPRLFPGAKCSRWAAQAIPVVRRIQWRAQANSGFNKVAPSILVGFGTRIPRNRRRFSLSTEFGIAYTRCAKGVAGKLTSTACSNPAVICVNAGTDPTVQANVQAEVAKVNHDVSFLKIYPLASVGFAVNF